MVFGTTLEIVMKSMKRVVATVGLCFIACLTLALFTTDSYAQGDSAASKSNDKNIASKKGVANSLASSEDRPTEEFDPSTGRMVEIDYDDEDTGPSGFQMGLGLGSIPVAYIVLKFL